MIAIFDATGESGTNAAELILARGKPVRLIGRSPDNFKYLTEKGAEVMIGDQTDEPFLAKAFEDAEIVYLHAPDNADMRFTKRSYRAMVKATMGAIEKASVRKVVCLAGFMREFPGDDCSCLEMELNALERVDVVVLRANCILENLFVYGQRFDSCIFSEDPRLPGLPIHMVTFAEISVKVAELLENPVFTGHSIVNLTGQKWFVYPRPRNVFKHGPGQSLYPVSEAILFSNEENESTGKQAVGALHG